VGIKCIKSGLGTESANLFQFLCGGALHAPPALLRGAPPLV
jgi:hypothetical protein